MSQYLSDRILGAANVQVRYDVKSPAWTAGKPSNASESARARRRKPTGGHTALFVAIGGVPNTDWAADTASSAIQLATSSPFPPPDQRKVPASWPLERAPYYLETAVPAPSRPGMCATARSSASPPQR